MERMYAAEVGRDRRVTRPSSKRLQAGRVACAGYGLVSAAFVVGLLRQEAWATLLWPWPDDRLTYLYLASLAAAIAAPFLYAAWSGELAALAPVALDATVVTAGMAIFLFFRVIGGESSGPLTAAAGSAVLAVVFALLFRRVRHIPHRDRRRTPMPVRAIMALLALIVLVVSGGLFGRVDGVFPWDLKSETSTMFGFVYLGVVVYFAYAAWHPAWVMTAGQLLGFLAYTAVLVDPYLDLLRERLVEAPSGSGSPLYGSYGGAAGSSQPNMVSLWIFLAVLTFGTVLGIWSLLLDPRTRLTRRRESG